MFISPHVSAMVKLATNYEKISRQGTATILLSKHISCIAIYKLFNCNAKFINTNAKEVIFHVNNVTTGLHSKCLYCYYY